MKKKDRLLLSGFKSTSVSMIIFSYPIGMRIRGRISKLDKHTKAENDRPCEKKKEI
jgi:hypothetical protein